MNSDDIVARLRRITARPLGLVIDPPPHPLCKEAADEIVRLRAEVERLTLNGKEYLAVESAEGAFSGYVSAPEGGGDV